MIRNEPESVTNLAQTAGPYSINLIRPLQERRRHPQAEGLRGLEVDRQLELRGLLDGEVGRLGTFEDAVDVPRRLAEIFGEIRTIGNQAAWVRKIGSVEIDRRDAVAGRQRNDQFTICQVESIRHHDEAATRIARLCSDNAFDLVLGVHRSGTHLDGKG